MNGLNVLNCEKELYTFLQTPTCPFFLSDTFTDSAISKFNGQTCEKELLRLCCLPSFLTLGCPFFPSDMFTDSAISKFNC